MGNQHIEPRKPQTKVKHTILEKYIGHWGGIILSGKRRSGSAGVPHFIYVDCDGSNGRYDGELEDHRAERVTPYTVFGSPVLGVQSLDKLVKHANNVLHKPLHTNAIIIERDDATYANLKKSLQLAGFGDRIRETVDFHSLKDGEIALVHADSTLMTRRLLGYTQKSPATYALYFIDPYGASGVPLQRFVEPIISGQQHDVILYMPYYDLHKKSGLTLKTEPNLSADQLNRIRDLNEMFDDNGDWQEIARVIGPKVAGLQSPVDFETGNVVMPDLDSFEPWRLTLAANREEGLVAHYKSQLESKDRDLIVKKMRLPFPECDLTMYYLFLTTHNETGALVMNKLLFDADLLSSELRQKLRDVTKHSVAQLQLFDPVAPGSTLTRPSIQDIADDIYEHVFMRGRLKLTRREAYKKLAHEPYFESEVERALTLLKKQGKISLDPSMGHNTIIRSQTA